MNNSAFFEAVNNQIQTPPQLEFRLLYDAKGVIINIIHALVDTVETNNYIVITQSEYDACNTVRDRYIVIDGKLVFSPTIKRSWYLEQDELARNPYVKS